MIRINDLSIQYEKIKEELHANIEQVLKHGQYIMGPEVIELEKRLADYVDVKYAISCSSGTDALLMTLMAWGVQKGDAVFTTPFTFVSTAEVASLLGATVVFIDIDPDTYNIDVNKIETAIKNTIEDGKLKPKAIIPVDLFGLPADYDKINDIARKYNIKVLEDGAQSFGGVYHNKKSGSLADAAATSFFPAKPLGCYGDGGAVFTNDADLFEKLKSIRVHGKGIEKYDNVRIGINGRLDSIQAAILLAKFSVFDEELKLRNEVAAKYTCGLKEIIKTPYIPNSCISSWAQYSILAKNTNERSELLEGLKDKGIQTAIYYKRPLHLQKAYENLGYCAGDFPVAEKISSRIFSLPMYPYLKDEDREFIINVMRSIITL